MQKYIFRMRYHENSLPIFNVISKFVTTFHFKVLLKYSLHWRIFCFLGHSRITVQIKLEYCYDSSIQQAFTKCLICAGHWSRGQNVLYSITEFLPLHSILSQHTPFFYTSYSFHVLHLIWCSISGLKPILILRLMVLWSKFFLQYLDHVIIWQHF